MCLLSAWGWFNDGWRIPTTWYKLSDSLVQFSPFIRELGGPQIWLTLFHTQSESVLLFRSCCIGQQGSSSQFYTIQFQAWITGSKPTSPFEEKELIITHGPMPSFLRALPFSMSLHYSLKSKSDASKVPFSPTVAFLKDISLARAMTGTNGTTTGPTDSHEDLGRFTYISLS